MSWCFSLCANGYNYVPEGAFVLISSVGATKLIWMKMDCDSIVAQALSSLFWMR